MQALDGIWNGPNWKLWTLLAGLLSVPLAYVIAVVGSSVTGERAVPMTMLILLAVILTGSVVGSGFIEKLSSQMNRGGLARESTEHIDKTLGGTQSTVDEDRHRESRDRLTIRAGLFVVAPVVAFVYLMTIV